MQFSPTYTISREIHRLARTAIWSVNGLRAAWLDEKSLRQWVAANVLTWSVMPFTRFEFVECVILIVLGLLTVIVELLNTAIEAAVDLACGERHPLAKKSKDVASGAVMLTGTLWSGLWIALLLWN